MPTKILMVCLGNICRSPVAEGVMQRKIEKYKLDAIVDSAGTSGYHIGEQPDERSMANARKHSIDISSLKARKFSVEDFKKFDLIYVMDANNYNDVLKLASSEHDKSKVDLLLNISMPQKNQAVPDPYYGNEDGFEKVFQLVDEACELLARKLSE
jgi:protein-tyrosine phosphatase